MPTVYNTIGKTYTSTRCADPRVTSRIVELLNLPTNAKIVDIGAGSGNYSYELADQGFSIVAVEPSSTMRAQAQAHPNLAWIDASAESLPLEDGHFDGAVMTLCLHHMDDWKQGIREAIRVTGGGPLIIFAFDIEYKADFWLFDYFPEFITVDKNWAATVNEVDEFVKAELNTNFNCHRFPLPKDLIDHFAAAAWARPELYLQQRIQDGISSFSKIDANAKRLGLEKLESDLDDGTWTQKYGTLLEQDFYDRGYVFFEIYS